MFIQLLSHILRKYARRRHKKTRPLALAAPMCYNTGKGGVTMDKIYFHVDVNSAFLSW